MKRLLILAIGFVTTIATTSAVYAQSKSIPGDAVTITATVEAIDAATRTLTVKNTDGTYEPITVPRNMTRFSEIKVGDTITARFYNNVVIRKKPAGEAAVDTSKDALTPGAGAKPGATAATQRTITATITAIDPKVPSITFKGENINWNYSSRVEDKNALAQVKVGDRVDITWTEALMVSLVAPKK